MLKKCSSYKRDCVKESKNMDKKKPDSNNIAKNVSDKVKNGGEETTGTGTEGTEVTTNGETTVTGNEVTTNGETTVDTTEGSTGGDAENNDVAKNFVDNSLKKEETKPKTFKKPEKKFNVIEGEQDITAEQLERENAAHENKIKKMKEEGKNVNFIEFEEKKMELKKEVLKRKQLGIGDYEAKTKYRIVEP